MITPFWYRRVTEIIVVLCLILSGMWGFSALNSDWWATTSLIITPVPAVLAIATIIVSVPLYIWGSQRHAKWWSLISYAFMSAAAGSLIFTTGHLESPFIVIWMLLSLFAGLFGVATIIVACLVDTAYVTYLSFADHNAVAHIPLFVLVFVMPLIISIIIWRRSDLSAAKGDNAYNALARELSQVANKSEIVINAIADGVIAVNDAGTIQIINPAAQDIMGWGKQDAMELDYRSVFRLTDNKDKPLDNATDPIQLVLRTNQSVTRNDLSLTTSAGKKMIISLLVSPVGQIGSGAIIVFRDITGDVAENRQKAEFISTASHEMRTPVAAIEGYIGLALNPATATIDDKARIYLTKAHESAQHLGQLFQDLLDVAKAEDGRLSNNPERIDVVTFVRDIVSGMLATANTKGLQLIYSPDVNRSGNNMLVEPVFYTSVDAGHFREILSNLIDNAVKYTKTGTVTVDVGGDESHVVISVVDTGLGIPKEDISHLFQKFYRVDNSDTREIGGTGLGLYLCRRLVESMDGRIWVESDYGKGSMFFVELPRAAAEPTSTSTPVSSQDVKQV